MPCRPGLRMSPSWRYSLPMTTAPVSGTAAVISSDLERSIRAHAVDPRGRSPRDGSRQRTRREFGPGNESDDGSERSRGRRAEEVEAGDGRSEAVAERRVSVDDRQRREEGREKVVASDIDTVARGQQHVVHQTVAAIVQTHPHAAVRYARARDRAAGGDGEVARAGSQPAGRGGCDRALREPTLPRDRESSEDLGPARDVTEECRTNVGPREEQRAQRSEPMAAAEPAQRYRSQHHLHLGPGFPHQHRALDGALAASDDKHARASEPRGLGLIARVAGERGGERLELGWPPGKARDAGGDHDSPRLDPLAIVTSDTEARLAPGDPFHPTAIEVRNGVGLIPVSVFDEVRERCRPRDAPAT